MINTIWLSLIQTFLYKQTCGSWTKENKNKVELNVKKLDTVWTVRANRSKYYLIYLDQENR